MNRDPHPPDPQDPALDLDPALLDEALAAELTPEAAEALQARILGLTDPATLSLLDEALAPGRTAEADNALADRIIAATTPAAPAVAGRIGSVSGFSAWRYAAAAMIVLAAGAGLWLIDQQPVNPGTELATGGPDSGTAPGVVAPEADELDLPETATAVFFAEATSRLEARIQDAADGLNTAINQDTVWSDLDAYSQFYSDAEAEFAASAT